MPGIDVHWVDDISRLLFVMDDLLLPLTRRIVMTLQVTGI